MIMSIESPTEIKKPLPGKETASTDNTITESQGYKSFMHAGELLKARNANTQEDSTPNLTSNYKEYRLEERLMDVVSAPDLCNEKIEEGTFLPFLGKSGLIRKDWTTLISGYPKIGKTELMIRLILEWTILGESVLYLTEEPRSVWQARLAQFKDQFDITFRIAFAMGRSKKEINELINITPASIIVVDTVRNLLGLENENDNSQIASMLNPLIALARNRNKTLILLHHTRKGGGMYGEAVSGGHAFLGAVDISLELMRHTDRRRIIKGSARVFTVPTLMYEMTEDGKLIVLGNPDELAIEEVRDRLLENITNDWVPTGKTRELIGKPEPSSEQVRQALDHLASENLIDRDPPMSEGSKPGKTYRWRKPKRDDKSGNLYAQVPA
jgi:predicted ATP-dependent serine protease